MSEKLVKVKNVSRNDFGLSLDFVTQGKHLDLKPNTIVALSSDEYTYLTTQCPGSFEKGFLEVIEIDKSLESEKIESNNVMSSEEISKLLDLTITKFKKDISGINVLGLLRDIRSAAVEANKSDKYIVEIDTQIEKNANGSILL